MIGLRFQRAGTGTRDVASPPDATSRRNPVASNRPRLFPSPEVYPWQYPASWPGSASSPSRASTGGSSRRPRSPSTCASARRTRPASTRSPWSSTSTRRLTAIGIIFSIAIVMLGLAAAVFGTWVDRNGPRAAMFTSAVLLVGRLPRRLPGHLHRAAVAALPRLRRPRRHRPGHRLHLAGLHADQVVPRPSGPGHRHGDHGLRWRRARRLAAVPPADELLRPRLRPGRRRLRAQRQLGRDALPDPGRRLPRLHDVRRLPRAGARGRLEARGLRPVDGEEEGPGHHGERLGAQRGQDASSSGCCGSCCSAT